MNYNYKIRAEWIKSKKDSVSSTVFTLKAACFSEAFKKAHQKIKSASATLPTFGRDILSIERI